MAISYKYATVNQAQEAGVDLFQQLTSGNRDTDTVILDAYTLVGYGASLGFPINAKGIAPATQDTERQLADHLRPLAQSGGQVAGLNLDWKSIAKLALQLLLGILA
jgi:hypothetical protein